MMTITPGDTTGRSSIVADSDGVFHLVQPFSEVWDARNVARPFLVLFVLGKKIAPAVTQVPVRLGPFKYPAAPVAR
jgi:hypothetical protein